MDNVRPVAAVGSDDWFRWVWLVGRGRAAQADTVDAIQETVLSDGCPASVRAAALNALWSLVPVSVAVGIERQLLDRQDFDLALAGLAHPRWWKDESWLAACMGWIGRDAVVDATVARVLSWTERSVCWGRVPTEVWERIGISRDGTTSWRDVLETGIRCVQDPPKSPFETFWRQHIRHWVNRWLQWEESVYLYQWRIREESDLVAWTGSEPYPAAVPEAPDVDLVAVMADRQAAETLYLTMLGLGYTLRYDQSVSAAAQWDGIWSSWSSSLHYMTFEILTNAQTTEWHIGGLTGALRDPYAVKRWGLSLD